MLEDFRLKIFLTLVNERRFTTTASKLGITQPSVSQNIAELEKKAGINLFERSRSEVSLTPAGHIFKKYAESISASYGELTQIFAPLEDAEIKIHASDEAFEYLSNQLLGDFLSVHSGVTLKRAEKDEADLTVSFVLKDKEKGTFELSLSPSDDFAATAIWKKMSYFI